MIATNLPRKKQFIGIFLQCVDNRDEHGIGKEKSKVDILF